MPQSICVFSSSSEAVAPEFFQVAAHLGAGLARRRFTLLYGGGRVGLMGALARSVHQHGGRVVGVIPGFLREREIAYEAADELIVTRDLRERKAVLEARADAFIALPGGFGTLEEILEILTLKQLQQHNKPVVFLNTGGFFDPLLEFFNRLYDGRFAKEAYRQLYHAATGPDEAFAYVERYQPAPAVSKWF